MRFSAVQSLRRRCALYATIVHSASDEGAQFRRRHCSICAAAVLNFGRRIHFRIGNGNAAFVEEYMLLCRRQEYLLLFVPGNHVSYLF